VANITTPVKGKLSVNHLAGGSVKAKLIGVTIIGVIALYLVFAYKKEFFPFTKENKAKLEKLFKGKGAPKDQDLSELERKINQEMMQGGDEEGLGGVDKYGNLLQPGGGTGAIPLDESGLHDPVVKGDEEMMSTYQQEMFRQLFLPYQQYPDFYNEQTGAGNLTPGFTPIARGGDLPPPGTVTSMPSPLYYPFPIDERLYNLYGLYPPGGTYRDTLGDYPYAWYPPGTPGSDIQFDDEDYGNLARVKAMRAARKHSVAYLGSDVTREQRQLGFSKLQNKARKMNRLNDPPVVRKGNMGDILPAAVAKRHLATGLGLA